MVRSISTGIAVVLLALSAPRSNLANSTVTMVVPVAAGGGNDVVARILTPRMSEVLGQQVVIENIGGAGGVTGAARVAKAAPDGYMFVIGNPGTHAQSQTMHRKPLFNAITDFAPVGLIGEQPLVLIARPDLPATNLQEFSRHTKANQSEDAVCIRRPGLRDPSRMRDDQRRHRRRRRACALSQWPGCDAGTDRRPDRLPVSAERSGRLPHQREAG